MKRYPILGVCIFALVLAGCTGGAAGSPSDDIGDIGVLTHSPGNGDTLRLEDSDNGYNALENPTLTNPGAVTLVFSNSVDPDSVIIPDPIVREQDPQGTLNVRLFFFDTQQGPFDPSQPEVPGVNPPGANVLVTTEDPILTQTTVPNDTLILRPAGITESSPMQEGQYSLIVSQGVRGADGDGMKGAEYFFFYRVGNDALGPVVVSSSPAPGERGVEASEEITVTMSETVAAATVNTSTITVTFQPTGATAPIGVPGNWFTDGGNMPGNNVPDLQLNEAGIPGFSGTSPRNGVDLVFKPDFDAFPPAMRAYDPYSSCAGKIDPPQKGNKGLPLGQSITVEFVTSGGGVTDTAGNSIPAGSPNTKFTFETRSLPDPIWAPGARGAVYYADTIGVGVIDVNPGRTPYAPGPNPPRSNNTVVTTGSGKTVRVPISDLADMTTDTRPYTAFYGFICDPADPVTVYMPILYAASRTQGGGQIVVIDTFMMQSIGRFATPSPGGVGVTAFGSTGRAAVSNSSANTVTIFDISQVRWFTGTSLPQSQGGLASLVAQGSATLILSEEDFEKAFPNQRGDVTSPPGPPVLGTINVGISPSSCKITGLPNSLGYYSPPFCYSPILSTNTIVCSANAGENTIDFSQLTNLNQSTAIPPDLDGVTLSSSPTDVAWCPYSLNTGAYYFFIAGIGGTVELFASGWLSNQPSVLPQASSNFAPNKIINNIGNLQQPTALQWIPRGNASGVNIGYTAAVLVAETGENRLVQMGITSESPSNLFRVINENHAAGQGPVDITGDPNSATFVAPCTPSFTTYYVANAGEGSARTADYQGGVIGTTIDVPGILLIASWWSR